MSNSSLVNINVPANASNYTVGRSGRKIEMITIHHMAGVLTAQQCGNIFATAGRGASAHYGIGKDADVGQYVDESNTSWANANWDSNCKAITIETSNCSVGGDYPVSDNVLNKLIQLVADIAKRNNLGKLVKGQNLTWHSMYSNTTCPGNYLRSKLDYIVEQANNINGYGHAVQEPNNAYKVGDHVVFSTCYNSSTAPNTDAIQASKMSKNHGVITKIVSAKNPYLLDNGLCWVNDGDIRGYYQEDPAQTVPVQPTTFTVRVDKAEANVRSQPNSQSAIIPQLGASCLKRGDTFKAVGTVAGESVNGNNIWYKSAKGNYVWSGGCSRI